VDFEHVPYLLGIFDFSEIKVRQSSILFQTTVTMVIPPSYSDLGKNARDLFNKGYSKYHRRGIHFGVKYSLKFVNTP
jgi:hypothetical protein